MKSKVGIIAAIALGAMIFTSGCGAEFDREMKSFSSNLAGGLNRTVSVYDNAGNLLRTYEGKIDLSESENEIFFDLNGKRIVIHGGIVIVEEK